MEMNHSGHEHHDHSAMDHSKMEHMANVEESNPMPDHMHGMQGMHMMMVSKYL